MKKNGFTLVELLGVITILAMLGLIIVPVINKIIISNKYELYNVQIRNIESGASNFVSEHLFDIPDNSSLGITLGKLKDLGYVNSDIADPVSKNRFSDDMIVVIKNDNGNFSYIVCDGSVNCEYVSVWE